MAVFSAIKTEHRGHRMDSWFGVHDYGMFMSKAHGPHLAEQHTTWRYGPLEINRTRTPSYVMAMGASSSSEPFEEIRSAASTHWIVKLEWRREHA